MTVQFDKLNREFSAASSPAGVLGLPRRKGLYRNGGKRLFESLLIVASLPIVVPLIAIMALCVLRDGHAPFYRSERVGKDGRVFRMVKLRTMVPDADALLEKHLAENPCARAEWRATQKLKNDPRVTPIGRLLRKTSMDELPQFWNVLTGDMALVGPRPMLPSQRELYPGVAYYALRPGITGPWQVSDRNDAEFVRRADHDQNYEKSLSLWGDIALLFKTVSVVVRGTGY